MSEDHLLYRVEGNIAHLIINREQQRNALSGQAISLFMKYLDAAETNEDIRVILVSEDKTSSIIVDHIESIDGDVILQAPDGIFALDSSSLVKGNRIEFY